MLTLATLDAIDGLRHAFFSRRGGVSEGVYASLNCGLGTADRPDNVVANRARALARLEFKPAALMTLRQVHGADVVEVDGAWPHGEAPTADGMVTTRRGLVLGILTADCAPVLLVDAEAGVIGAAHAGWRGGLAGIVEASVRAMVRCGAEASRIVAAIGPCIAQPSYEVGPEFPAPFLAADPAHREFFAPAIAGGKLLFDLRGFLARRLGAAGLERIFELPHDTCREDRFYSHRRAVKRGEADYGRLLSAIALEP
ncbi:MAG: peptidoglycan editing factor PgeF [Pseudomonadota bacterium]